MSRKRKPLPILTDILITDVAAEGKAIAKVDNLVIFCLLYTSDAADE